MSDNFRIKKFFKRINTDPSKIYISCTYANYKQSYVAWDLKYTDLDILNSHIWEYQNSFIFGHFGSIEHAHFKCNCGMDLTLLESKPDPASSWISLSTKEIIYTDTKGNYKCILSKDEHLIADIII